MTPRFVIKANVCGAHSHRSPVVPFGVLAILHFESSNQLRYNIYLLILEIILYAGMFLVIYVLREIMLSSKSMLGRRIQLTTCWVNQ